MKKINYLLVLITTSMLLIAGCGKEGAVGPQGVAGTQGGQGAVGATGADGTKIYSGTGAPTATLGTAGDFYLNVSNSNFYGPKTSSGWGAATNLKGATGATGAAGSKIYSGTLAPAASLGANGDYYLNTANYLFYGPKAGGVWSAPISLKGPQGPAGTANVIYSDWYTPATYAKTTVFGTTYFTANIAASKITQAILDNGTVVVYAKLNGYNPVIWPTDQVSQLPISINYMSGTTPNLDVWSAAYTVGNVSISLTSSTNAYSSISNAHQFRYVIIPGGVKTLSVVNLKNYKEVQQALHIND